MFISKKEDIKVGQHIWCGWDDRPLDGYGYSEGIVTKIFDDHYLFNEIDTNMVNVWGIFDDEPCSVANFTTKEEVLDWLNYRNRISIC